MESWKPIPFAPDYDVSDHGRVRSWKQWGGRASGRRSTPFLKRQRKDRNGYLRVTLMIGEKLETHRVARLVALAFVGEPPTGMRLVRHLDGSPTNNVPGNLAWGDDAGNAADKVRHGRSMQGERHANAKISNEESGEVVRMCSIGIAHKVIAARFGISKSLVSMIHNGKVRNHLRVTAVES